MCSVEYAEDIPLRLPSTQLPPTRSGFSKRSNGIPRSGERLGGGDSRGARADHARLRERHRYSTPIPGPTCSGGPSGPSSASARPASAPSSGRATGEHVVLLAALGGEVALDDARALATLVDRPHDQRLPAARVAGCEDSIDGGRVGPDRLRVAALVALHAEPVEQPGSGPTKPIASSTSCAGSSRSVPATGANGGCRRPVRCAARRRCRLRRH